MKKWMAMLLTCSMVFQTWMGVSMPVYGADASAAAESVVNETQSIVEVGVRSSLQIPFWGKVTVQICQNDEVLQEKDLDFDVPEVSYLETRFEIPEGDYIVVIKADKFAKYTQEIRTVKNEIRKIEVSSAQIETGSSAVWGWMRPGDLNGDGIIDETDSKEVLSALRTNSTDTDIDINGDGKQDLADLQYVVQSIEEEPAKSTVEELSVIRETKPTAGTVVDGSISNFLNHAGTIALKPENTNTEISADNRVGLDFDLTKEDLGAVQIQGIVIHAPMVSSEEKDIFSEITDGIVSYTDENGEVVEIPFSSAAFHANSKNRAAFIAKTEADGSWVIDFGDQIAVKRVTIQITGTRKTEPLVNIAKVEFVNDMETRIPAPQMDIPTLHAPQSENKGLFVSWTEQTNVTGYEVYVSGPVKNQTENETQIVRVANSSHRISSIQDKPLQNFAEYTIKVRSVNGDWSSPWSNEQIGVPKPTKLPAPPDNVNAVGGFRTIEVTWKDMDDSDGYMVYYKKSQEADTMYRPVVEGFTPVTEGTGKLSGTRYVIGGLEDGAEYLVYVIGWNDLGWGKPSLTSLAKTKSTTPPQLPNYKLINTSNGEGRVSAHILNAAYGGSGNARMVGSALDTTPGSALGLVDNNFGSYWEKEDWDDGVAYPVQNLSKGMVVSLDQDYQMNFMTFAGADQKAALQYVRLGYWNSENPDVEQFVGARLIAKQDSENQTFYIIKFDKAITANRVHICLGRDYSRLPMMVGEIHFHHYDSLEDDIMNLYIDEMHTTLRDDVDEAAILALEERLEKTDEISQEKHPLYQELSLELKTAREILSSNLEAAYEVDNRITARKDGHLGFGGLNAWQPLGKTAYAGESLLVYVGHNTKRSGDSTDLQLVFTQQHAESSTLARSVSLKIGRNEIIVPQITTKDFERGGQLYVAYTGNNAADQYAVRISGGSSIPVLRVFGKTGAERTEAIRVYVEQLENYVGTISSEHETKHTGIKSVDYPYDSKNCILNATDIMMREMMYSVPATQVWAGIRNAPDKVTKLDNALKAMERTMTLFYQHKGLSDEAGTARGNNNWPAQHLNIRYMRMFAGAFMYAAGNHIGVEWNSTGLASGPNDWSGFGWGVAHEIGHNINQGTYAVAEITNNYFAQLLTKELKGTRFQYENVYKKVTSNTTGRSSNVATQLALYWQLHLAFDNETDDKHIFDNYEQQFQNLFFARVDTYSRNPAKAPQEGLTLDGGTDQNLMRLACAAANKNILPFFVRWGMVPDETTRAYADKYGEEETKALYYVNDDARDYRAAHKAEDGTIQDTDAVVSANVTVQGNQAEISIATDRDKDLILGYEISRSMSSNGKKATEVIGFVPIDTVESTVYVDTISTINNRVMEYEVRAVDKYLNYSNVKQAGSVKIQTDGVLEKSEWTVQTTLVSQDDVEVTPDQDNPDSGYDAEQPGEVEVKKVNSIEKILDNDRTDTGTYHGTSDGTAEITIDMHKLQQITSMKYQGCALSQVKVEISADGENWTTVKENAALENEKEQIIWFDSVNEADRDTWIGTYDARYLKVLFSQSGDISIREIEICGPTGDNLEFMTADDGLPAIGVLTEDYIYGSKAEDVILKGSLIFTGTYKGNPAYNVVLLYDKDGNVIGEKDGNVLAGQVIFAKVPAQGNLGETSDGTWVYYIAPGQWDMESVMNAKSVRGELYRVDNALTLEGERIVSDTKFIQIPETLPDITLQGGMYEKLD